MTWDKNYSHGNRLQIVIQTFTHSLELRADYTCLMRVLQYADRKFLTYTITQPGLLSRLWQRCLRGYEHSATPVCYNDEYPDGPH